MSDHAFLAPSSADIWGAPDGCPAYPRMAAAYPDEEDTPESREGTAAHDYVAAMLNGATGWEEGTVANNGHPITAEMVECAEDLLADVATWRPSCGHRFVIEQRLHMSAVHPTLNWGTCDIGGADFEHKVLYGRDYKYGHRYVDAWGNLQLVDYGVGLLQHFGVSPDTWREWSFNFGIFQPRCYHPEGPKKLWCPTGPEFLAHVRQLQGAAAAATQPDAPFTTGQHCRDCSARYDCPALIAAGGASVDLSLRGVPQVLTPQRAGLVRKHLAAAIERLEALQSGIDAQIEAYIRKGQQVPGVEMRAGNGREFWTVPVEEVEAIGDLFGKKLAKLEPITPAQARKLGIDESVISAYSDRRRGELKVTAVEDNRAAKAFK